MLLAAICALFLVPIYYSAMAKGYSGKGIIAVSLAAMAAVRISEEMVENEMLPYLFLAIPLLGFCLIRLLPSREGAPGTEYLTIEFTCPECEREISFPRHREGLAVVCPECDEVIRVPRDALSPELPSALRAKPEGASGEVCFESVGSEAHAYQVVALLESEGIAARVSSDSGGGMLPHVGFVQGHRVMIDVSTWDDAVALLDESNSV